MMRMMIDRKKNAIRYLVRQSHTIYCAMGPKSFSAVMVRKTSKQAVSLIKNLTNSDNDNSMNMSTKMETSQVNKPANKVQTMQYVKINIRQRRVNYTPNL